MIELLTYGFMQRALGAGILAGLLGGLVGVFLVQRRLAFLAAGVSHGSFAAIGLGLVLGVAPFQVALPAAVGLGLAIAWLRRRGLAEDTLVGVLFAVGMALGVILLELSDANASLSAFLFGSILAIGPADLTLLAVVTAGVGGFLLLAWGRLTLVTFDRELAQASGLPVAALDYAFFAAASLAIIASVKLVGIVLVSSFFVVPAATARLVGGSFAAVTTVAALLGALTAVAGLLLSWYLEVPVGALMVMVQAAVFGAVVAVRRLAG